MPWNDKDVLTPQALNARSGLVFNVQDPEFGAVGDGVTDDAAAIQAAIDAASTAGGGSVFFPSGVHNVESTINLASRVDLIGAGAGRSTIYSAVVGQVNTVFGDEIDRVLISGLRFENFTEGSGITFDGCTRVAVESCVVLAVTTPNASAASIRFRQGTTQGTQYGAVRDCYLETPGSCVFLQGGSGLRVEDIIVTGNIIVGVTPNFASGNELIKVDQDSIRVVVSNNVLTNSVFSSITVEDGAKDVVVEGNIMDIQNVASSKGVRLHAPTIDITNVTIVNNIVRGGEIGLALGTVSVINGGLIANNQCIGQTVSAIEAGGTNYLIQGNTCYGAKLRVRGTGVIVQGNAIYGASLSTETLIDSAIIGNYVSGGNLSVFRATGVKVAGNVILEWTSAWGIVISGDTPSGSDIDVTGNIARTVQATGEEAIFIATGADGVRIWGNNLEAPAGRIQVDGGSTNIDNFDGLSAAYTRNATVVEDRTLLASASATILNNNNVLAALIADLTASGTLG